MLTYQHLPQSSPVPSPPQINETDQSLENLLIEKVNNLAQILSQIHNEINNRKKLSHYLIYRLYNHYFYVKSYFLILDHGEIGGNRSIELRRSRLEQQLNNILQEKRLEQSRCWKDIAQLNKESRQWLKQYMDLVERVKIVIPEKFQTKNIQDTITFLPH